MSRTITAMFDSRSEAEAARERLTEANIDAGRVQIVDQSSGGANQGANQSANQGGNESGGGSGFFSSLKEAFMPDEDRSAYGEGVRRGGCLLCAQVDEQQADQAIRVLEETGSVDFDQRQEQWRSEGWTPGAEQQTRGRATEEQHIPIVEEQLRVGKREVERGGARVRSYVEEVPVSEQVALREEHVSIERRPVDREISSADLDKDDLLRNREIEMTERSEEAVVGKEARVREELVVRKEANERTETVSDTVRHTEVEVDQIGGRQSGVGGDRPAFGFSDGGSENAERSQAERESFERGETSRR